MIITSDLNASIHEVGIFIISMVYSMKSVSISMHGPGCTF